MISTLNANNVIDVDDILSEDFMPGNLLMLEHPETSSNNFNKSVDDFLHMKKPLDGSFDRAMQTMGFHRYLFIFSYIININ